MFIIDFFSRNIDDIILLVVGVIIGLLVDYIKKVFISIIKYISKLFKFIIRKLRGVYTLNDLIKLEKIPKDQLTKKQERILDDYHRKIKDVFKDN